MTSSSAAGPRRDVISLAFSPPRAPLRVVTCDWPAVVLKDQLLIELKLFSWGRFCFFSCRSHRVTPAGSRSPPTRLHRPPAFKRCRSGCQRIPETSEQIWNGDVMTSTRWQKGSLLPEEEGGEKNNGFAARVENKLLHQIILDWRHESPSQVTHELRADPDLSTTLWWVLFPSRAF